MKTRLVILMLACWMSFTASSVFAQDNNGSVIVETPVPYDEEGDVIESDDEVEVGHFQYQRAYMNEYELEAFRRKKEFQYKDLDSMAAADSFYLEPPKPSEPRKKKEFEGFDASILLWLIVAIAVVVIILQLAGINMRQLFSSRKLVSDAREEGVLSENIHEIPYDTAIRQAISAGNFSLATRLMYLQSLKMLSDRNLIVWHQHKTNWQYVYELKNEKLRNSFRNITHIFEYVQYGHMTITADKFSMVQDAFGEFKQRIT